MRRSSMRFAFIPVFAGWFIGLFSSVGPAVTRAQPSERVRAHVRLVALGRFVDAWIQPIAEALEAKLGVQAIVVDGAIPLPASVYYSDE